MKRMIKSSSETMTWEELQDALAEDFEEGITDPIYEFTAAGEYLGELQDEVASSLGVELLPSVQAGAGIIQFYKGDEVIGQEADYTDFNDETLNLAASCPSLNNFKSELKSYIKTFLAPKVRELTLDADEMTEEMHKSIREGFESGIFDPFNKQTTAGEIWENVLDEVAESLGVEFIFNRNPNGKYCDSVEVYQGDELVNLLEGKEYRNFLDNITTSAIHDHSKDDLKDSMTYWVKRYAKLFAYKPYPYNE